MARGVGSRVTMFAQAAAEKQSAYGVMENALVVEEDLDVSMGLAALGRFKDPSGYAIVAVDGSSLKLTDATGRMGSGPVGSRDSTRGLLVQTGLALSSSGTPLGIAAQVYWARPLKPAGKKKGTDRRRTDQEETARWLEVVSAAEARACDTGMVGRLWLQMDRGYDCRSIMNFMGESRNRVSVRGEYDRALWVDDDTPNSEAETEHRRVQEALAATPIFGVMELKVPGGHERTARIAHMEVRLAPLTLRLSNPSRRETVIGSDGKEKTRDERLPCALTAVQVHEVGTTPDGEEPQDWLIWVNFDVETLEAAMEVIKTYSLRWRIEEFHRMWESGAMRIEETQVRSFENAVRVARMAAAVAVKLLAMSYVARTAPETLASTELPEDAIDLLAIMDPRSPRAKPRTEKPRTMAWAVAVIADLGGYTGKSSGGPPGPTVLARGHRRLQDALIGYRLGHGKRDQ